MVRMVLAMQLIALLRNDPWTPLPGRVIRHSMEDGPRLDQNYHEAIRNANREKVIAALSSGRQGVASIAEKAGMDYTTAKSHLDKLIKAGKVASEKEISGRGRKVIYWVVK